MSFLQASRNNECGLVRKPLQRERCENRGKEDAVFLDVMPCTMVEVYRHFGGSLVNIYQTALCHILENGNVNGHCHENFKCSIALLRVTREGKE
jgi:hypothetical protein